MSPDCIYLKAAIRGMKTSQKVSLFLYKDKLMSTENKDTLNPWTQVTFKIQTVKIVNDSIKNHLLIIVAKPRVLVINIWRKRTTTRPINILGQDIELVDTYKYLGVHFKNRLKVNTEGVS